MADWYATNQFANYNDYESGTPLANQPADNPQFLYPGPRIPNIYDRPSRQFTNTEVQRGFIRGLIPEIVNQSPKEYKSAKIPTRRCFFQFNPNLILRSVQASSTTMMPLLQDPTQILQPIPGQSSFEFQLMFNREREVSGQQYRDSSGNIVQAPAFSDPLASYGDTPMFSQEQVSTLGVLVDLYVLDSIIGQSITSDMIDFVQAYAEQTKNLRKTTTTNNDGSTKTDTSNQSSSSTLNDSISSDKLNRILGNTAFLSPMPIRIVFSSLFMVEGYVTASNVAFHKFTKTMVPTVCTVTLNVQALYIGFAKKNSYVSEMLSDGIKESQKIKEADEKAAEVVKKHLKNNINISLSYLHLGNIGSDANFTKSLNESFDKTLENSFDSKFTSKDNYMSNKEGLCMWGNTELQSAVGGQITDISMDSLQLVFVDTTQINKTPDQLVADAENGDIFVVSTGGYSSNGRGYQKGIISVVDIYSKGKQEIKFNKTSDNLDKADYKNPLNTEWESSTIDTYGYTTGSSNFFTNHKIAVVMVATLSATAPGAASTNIGTITVNKAVVVSDFDPTNSDYWKAYRDPTNSHFSKRNFRIAAVNPSTMPTKVGTGKNTGYQYKTNGVVVVRK